MSDYKFSADGKLHTRYSELIRCTTGQIDRVIDERLGEIERVETDDMKWGTERHDMWREETAMTEQLPDCFGGAWPDLAGMAISHNEQEFVIEILPGIVIHSRMDAVSEVEGAVIDYKTALMPEDGDIMKIVNQYNRSRQLTFYAYMLGINSIRIRKGYYMIEFWNRERTEIVDYQIVEKRMLMSDLGKVLPWVKDRVALLNYTMRERGLL